MTTIPLKKTITTHEGPTNTLNLREPLAKDFIQMNELPFKTRTVNDEVQVDIDFGKSAEWLAMLSGHDEVIIGTLSRMDFLKAIGEMNQMLISDGDEPGNLPA